MMKRPTADTSMDEALGERITYGLGTAALIAVPPIGSPWVDGALALVAAAATGRLWHQVRNRRNRDGMQHTLDTLTTGQRILPILTAAPIYAAAAVVDGTSWWEYAAPAAWGLLMGRWVPVTRSRWAPLPLTPVAAPADPFAAEQAAKWEAAEVAPGTRLEHITREAADRDDFTAVIVAPDGKAVPRMELVDIAAAFGVPVGCVAVSEIPKVGPGYLRLHVTPSQKTPPKSFEDTWAEKIAAEGRGIPGSRVVKIREFDGGVMFLAEVDEGDVVRINHAQLCSAFSVKSEELRLVAESDGGNQALVTLYDTSPLTGMRKATRDMLTPDKDGYFTVGTAHDGTDVEGRLFGPGGAVHGYIVGVTGSGKTVGFVLCLAAQANGGAVSWMSSLDPDAQLAAAGDYIDRQGYGRLFTARMLRAAVALMTIRGEINKEVGHDFSANSPYPLLILNIDELNGQTDESDLGEEIAEMATWIVERGRKYGIGLTFGAQTVDLSRIGGDRSLREQTRSGTGIVLRTASGISSRQATEGMLPEGVSLATIPQHIGGGLTMQDRMEGRTQAARGIPTAGMGHVLNGDAPRMMRLSYVHLPKDGTGHNLDDIFPEGGLINELTPPEIDVLTVMGLLGDWMAPEENEAGPESGTGGGTAVLTKPAKKTKAPNARDKVLAVLTQPMTRKQIRAALDGDLGPGTVNNAVTELFQAGRICEVANGVYAPLDDQGDA